MATSDEALSVQELYPEIGAMGFLREAFRLMKAYKLKLTLFVFVILLQVGFFLSLPIFYREICDHIIPQNDIRYLGQLSLLLPILFVIEGVSELIDSALMSGMMADALRDLRRKIYQHLQDVPLSFFTANSAGEVVTEQVNNLTVIEQGLANALYNVIFHSLLLFTAFLLMFFLDWSLALIALVALPLGILGPLIIGSQAKRLSADSEDVNAQATGFLLENVLAQKVVRAFALQAHYLEKFMVLLGTLHSSNRKFYRTTIFLGKSSSMAVLLIQLLVMLGGGYMASVGYISGGSLVAFWALLTGVGNSVRSLMGLSPDLSLGAVGIQRVNRFLAEPVEVSSDEQIESLTLENEISFKDVSFGYTDETRNLDDVSFTIPKGQKVAFVGRSGSGKSTIFNLLTRFYRTSEGSVSIDGHDLNQISEAALRSQLSVVFQEPFIFSETIRENIRVGRLDATDSEVEEAARLAEMDGFVSTLPQGYDTRIGDGGNPLSVGQRQRITLARALLQRANILLLDEVTASLDAETEVEIHQTLENLSSECILISMTNRLSSVVQMDHVYVLDQGRLIEKGTHKELLNNKGYYYNMWQSFTLELTQDIVMHETSEKDSDVGLQSVVEDGMSVKELRQEVERLHSINQRWAKLAGTDRLTELPNRLSFLQALVPQDIQQAQRDGDSLGEILISGDNLGLVNERHGRAAGDLVIKSLSEALQSVIKGEEQLGHLDGANFAVSMYPANLTDVQQHAEVIRAHIEAHPFLVDGEEVRITVSVGATSIDTEQITDVSHVVEDAYSKLNDAVFKAKSAGGNQVIAVA
jgi:ATP-binding cassette, subfamily B, bacterial